MLDCVYNEALIQCDICPFNCKRVAKTGIKNIFFEGWLTFDLEGSNIDICPDCVLILLSNDLNPSVYTTQFKIKEAFNNLRWKLRGEKSK